MTQELLDNTTVLEIVKIVAPGLLGGIGAWWAMRVNSKREQQKKDNEVNAKLKIHYLNPLRVSAQVLCNRLININDRVDRSDTFLHDTILQLKANNSEELQEGSPYKLWKNAAECFQWANHMGQFAISTLRITAIYLYRANKIIQDLPYVQLSSGNDTELLRHLTRVGSALGGQFGICEELHDSLGNYMLKEDGSIMNYREFCCSEIFNKINWLWFLKMFDFYGDFHLKTANERQEMIKSLQALCTFLQEAGADAGVHV